MIRGRTESRRARPRGATRSPDGDVEPRGREVGWLTVRCATHHNLKKIDARFPLGRLTCVTGVSGSGKSSLLNDIVYRALARDLNRATTVEPGRHAGIDGLHHLDKVIAIDQSPIGRTPRSNPATYIKVFGEIRQLFAKLPDARLRGYKPGRFSFNVSGRKGGGRCEACEGNGANRIEMDFLADLWVTCPVCEGRRFTRETLQVQYKQRSISDVLEMDVQQALEHFESIPRIRSMLQTLHDVGLDYIKLGQPSTTLSGGEAQRIKLARELVKRSTGRTLYVLDEPTTGLHFDDIRKLLAVLHGFVDAGNTVVVIEHNLDVVKTADWIIDLGPEGGDAGGYVVVEGTPEEVAECATSYTGQALREVLNARLKVQGPGPKVRLPALSREPRFGPAPLSSESAMDAIVVRGARQHNLKDLTVAVPRDRMTVCTGVSGSGKTSLAIDTLYTEGHRRYVESLSAYARQFLGQMAKPQVDHVEGLSPAICIEQKAASKSPRSTVGTITEIYDYMRVLWARVGTPHCPRCQVPIGSQTVDEICDRVFALEAGAPIIILAPVTLGDGETYAGLFNRLKSSGYTRVRIDGQIQRTVEATTLDARRRHRVEVVIDRTVVRAKARGRITESVEHALSLGSGVMTLLVEAVEKVIEDSHEATEPPSHAGAGPREQGIEGSRDQGIEGARDQDAGSAGRRSRSDEGTVPSPERERGEFSVGDEGRAPSPERQRGESQSATRPDAESESPTPDQAPTRLRVRKRREREFRFSQKLACPRCGTSYEELSPHHFSFNSQLGWCETCEGLGVQRGAPATAIIKNPGRSLLGGAIAGWPHIDRRSPLGRMLTALCEHLGVDVDTPLREWTATQKRALMFGTTGDWIDGSSAFAGGDSNQPALRFHWRGFFPAMDAATRNSWLLRHRLHHVVTDIPCVSCRGGRLRPESAAVRLGGVRGKTIVEVCELPLSEAAEFFKRLRLTRQQRQIAGELLHEIHSRLQFLVEVGLGYLTLHRAAPTLAGGEAQRIRLASQIGSGLSGVLYVLDEPTIGLHPRDTQRLIQALKKLRNLGNTLLLVEHDRDVIRSADRLLDFGPRAGRDGGEIVAEGAPGEFARKARRRGRARTRQEALKDPAADAMAASLTRDYLAGVTAIPIPTNRRPVDLESHTRDGRPVSSPREDGWPASSEVGDANRPPKHRARTRRRGKTRWKRAAAPALPHDPDAPVESWLVVRGARQNNLEDIDVPIPLGRFVCVTGVSGSGKSSLISDILWPALARALHRANLTAGEHDRVDGVDALDKVSNVDQSPIGNTPSSNPATYTGTFDWIRELFARLPDSKIRGWEAKRFSFNRPGGRCEACEGYGQKCIEMHFMPDVWVECEVCEGRRYNPETLEVRFKGKSIADVLDMSVAAALELFANVPKVRRMLQTLVDVGLDYVPLGQPAPTLSGGEAQRVKLAAELGKPDTGRTFYLLDEPTTGLHFDDIRKLLGVIHRLVDLGNTVLVIEHNLDVIKSADWVIDLGPEAGDAGGHIVVMGTPEQIASGKWPVAKGRVAPPSRRWTSHTGAALRPILQAGPHEARARYDPAAHAAREMQVEKQRFGDIGKEVRMPWQVDGRRWHLEQRASRDDQPRHWEPAALEYVEELVQKSGNFEPTNWNNRASVEITAAGAQTWFLHALTGGEWLLELCFLVPPKTFNWLALDAQLGLRTLDERDDLQTYGDRSRVDIRSRKIGMEAIVVYVHDKAEIDTPGFRQFIKRAAQAYLKACAPRKSRARNDADAPERRQQTRTSRSRKTRA
jgi:excinuclease ABC subunit A